MQGDAVKSIMSEELSAESSAFFQPFLEKNMHSSISEPNRQVNKIFLCITCTCKYCLIIKILISFFFRTRLRTEAKQAYNDHVLPTITKFRKFVQDV